MPSLRRLAAHALALATLAVAALPASAQARFQVSADGQEVVDTTTKLTWRRCAEGMRHDGKACVGKPARLSFAQATKQAGAAGGGWRLPTREEMVALLDANPKQRPRLDAAAFPQTPSLPFWARRPDSNDDLNQWLVSATTGRVTANLGQKKFALRLVRGGA